MSYHIKIFLILIILSLALSEIEFTQCENNTRKIIFENGTSETFPCISCPVGQYTNYFEEENIYNCSICESGTSNYGQNIILNHFSEKKLLKYYYSSFSECENDNDKLCPEWKINPLSLRVDGNSIYKSISFFTIKPFYMNDGQLIIKYINYNGGIDKYFNIYINNNLVYKDDSEHSIIKIKYFNINKGENIIKFEYIIDNNLSSKKNNYDDNSYFEIFEIQMINAETSSLECDKYDTIEELKNTIHNNCDYYVNKCSTDDYCNFRFYSEQKSEYCNLDDGSQTISYNKIEDSICSELIIPPNIDVECEHCTYGQYLVKHGENGVKCDYCVGNSYSHKIINDEESCGVICDIQNKLINKVLYITEFEDPSQTNIENINITLYLGYIEVKYEKFNEKENTNIFIEINDLYTEDIKTIELANPEEENIYKFNIPIKSGSYDIKIKGKNFKISKISIKGTDNGGNFRCVDELNNENEVICPNEKEHYSKIENKCFKCIDGTNGDINKECIFINQLIDNKFTLDNSLLNNKILSSSYNLTYEENNYFLNFNPGFPLIYFIDKNSNTNIIGKELHKIKLVKGINNRGIILSFISEDNDKKFISNIFIKCKINDLKDNENIILDKIDIIENTNYYFFTIQTNYSCPYCLDSEITTSEETECVHKRQLVNVEIKNNSLCVIKPFDNYTISRLENDKDILLNSNSTDEEDKLLISSYEINENIPINYEKENDEINTAFLKNVTCVYKRKSISEMGTGIILLLIIAGIFVLFIIGIIIWKIFDIRKRKKIPERLNPSLTELTEQFSTAEKNDEIKENIKN